MDVADDDAPLLDDATLSCSLLTVDDEVDDVVDVVVVASATSAGVVTPSAVVVVVVVVVLLLLLLPTPNCCLSKFSSAFLCWSMSVAGGVLPDAAPVKKGKDAEGGGEDGG